MADNSSSAQPSKIAANRVGANMVLAPKTALTHSNYKDLQTVLDEHINQNRFRIVLDFKNVAFVDSRGLELLLHYTDHLKDQGGTLKIINLNPVCRDVLLVTRLINIFNVFGDLNEALRA